MDRTDYLMVISDIIKDPATDMLAKNALEEIKIRFPNASMDKLDFIVEDGYTYVFAKPRTPIKFTPIKDPRFTLTHEGMIAGGIKRRGDTIKKMTAVRAKEIDDSLTKIILPLLTKKEQAFFLKLREICEKTAESTDAGILSFRLDALKDMKALLDINKITILKIQLSNKIYVQHNGKQIAGPI